MEGINKKEQKYKYISDHAQLEELNLQIKYKVPPISSLSDILKMWGYRNVENT